MRVPLSFRVCSALGWLDAVTTAELRVKGARHHRLGSSCLILASTTSYRLDFPGSCFFWQCIIPRFALLRCVALRRSLRLHLYPTNDAYAETLLLMLTPLVMPVAEPKTLEINPVPSPRPHSQPPLLLLNVSCL